MSGTCSTVKVDLTYETNDGSDINTKELLEEIIPTIADKLCTERDEQDWIRFLTSFSIDCWDKALYLYGENDSYVILSKAILEQHPNINKAIFCLRVQDEREGHYEKYVFAQRENETIKNYLTQPIKTITWQTTEIEERY